MQKNKILRIPRAAIIRSIYFTKKMYHLSRYFVDAIYSKLIWNRNLTVSCESFSSQTKKNLCIFSHYDPENMIDPYVIYYLNELYKCDCDIIFVSTCKNLNDAEKNKIKFICKKIIVKENRGLDFSAYKCGLQNAENLHDYNKLIFANDSIYGPFFNLNNILLHGDKHKLDMWGATDSYMIKYHVQSYFVVFSKNLFQNPLFHKFLEKIYNLGLKNNIIIRYEIGMSQYFLRNGFKLGAYCSCPTLENHINHDPSHHSWDKLILDNQYPFIKRMLLRDNPHEVDIKHWRETIKSISSFDINFITNHLNRITAGIKPCQN